MVGMVGALDCRCFTWFGWNIEYVHAINMMPFTPITEELLRAPFVAEEYPVLVSMLSVMGVLSSTLLTSMVMCFEVLHKLAVSGSDLALVGQHFSHPRFLLQRSTLYW